MDNSTHAGTDAETRRLLPGEKHNRDLSNPGEVWAFVLALVLIAALGLGFVFAGLAGVGLVMVAVVPVLYIVLVTISVGRWRRRRPLHWGRSRFRGSLGHPAAKTLSSAASSRATEASTSASLSRPNRPRRKLL